MFAQRSPIVIIQNITSAVFGYIGLFFVLRYIGAADWGYVAFGIGFVGIVSLVGDLGYSTAHTIKIADGEDIGVCNGTFLSVKLFLGILFVALVVGSLEVWTRVLHRGFESPIEYWIILSLIPYFFFQNFIGFTNTYFRATLKSVRASVPSLIEAMLRNSIFIALALVIHYSTGQLPDYRAALYVSTTYSITFTVYFLTSLYMGRPWKISRPTRPMIKSYTLLALPLMLVASVGTISGNIDKVFIQFFWHSDPTGAFFTSQQISTVITTISSSLSMFFLPLLVRTKNIDGKLEHNKSIFEFEKMISLYLLPFAVILIVLAPYVMNIFTANYIIYSGMLSLLGARAYIAAINSPYSSAIASRSKTKTIAKIDTSMVLLNIFLIVIMVPPNIFGYTGFSLGWIGAPVAMLTVAIISTVIYRLVVARMESIHYNTALARHLVPALFQAALIFGVLQFIQPRSIFLLVPLVLASLGIYFAVAVAMKETSVDLLIEIVRNFSPGRLRKRYSDEDVEAEAAGESEFKKDY